MSKITEWTKKNPKSVLLTAIIAMITAISAYLSHDPTNRG